MIESLNSATRDVIDFFRDNKKKLLKAINNTLLKKSGIAFFVESQEDLDEILNYCSSISSLVNEPDRAEFGDFQTNRELTDAICFKLSQNGVNPTILIEPTFGKGNFILSAINSFPQLKKIIGVEIYKPYVYQTKFSILDHYLNNENDPIEIVLNHCSFFDFDLDSIIIPDEEELLILGNPPWVTNSKLTTLNSDNLPKKSNFKKHSGLLAITGKGDFDIGEFITLELLNNFSSCVGHLSFLIKNSVIKNITQDQFSNNYAISNLKKWQISTLKEFNANTDSSIFHCTLNTTSEFTISEFDFYSNEYIKTSGWVENKFVSNVESYKNNRMFDGKSPFIWRSGVKHDCSKIMEFQRIDKGFENKLKHKFQVEEEYIYRILKSSDLNKKNSNPNRFTIITQRKVGQDTYIIKERAPKTYNYLESNETIFQNRKSSIYKNKPRFSIFGIGDYSFKPYKVAIASMYKKFEFMLLKPEDDKCLMVDDTCYFIGFESLTQANFCIALLNNARVQEFIKSLAFLDTQRVINKELLSRIDLLKIATELGRPDYIQATFEDWEEFIKSLKDKVATEQLSLF